MSAIKDPDSLEALRSIFFFGGMSMLSLMIERGELGSAGMEAVRVRFDITRELEREFDAFCKAVTEVEATKKRRAVQ